MNKIDTPRTDESWVRHYHLAEAGNLMSLMSFAIAIANDARGLERELNAALWLAAQSALQHTPARVAEGDDALHASAPLGHKCADCTMDKEACPTCYAAWWKRRHPNTVQI